MSNTTATPTKRYSLRPSWLTDSLRTLETFQKTSDAVREEFDNLSVAFDNFEVASRRAAESDKKHAANLASGFKSQLETPQQRKEKLIIQSKNHKFVCLPIDIHGRILCFLDLFGVDNLMNLSQVIRHALSFDEVWKPWAEERWHITQAEGEGGNLKKSWLVACNLRSTLLRPIILLCDEYRHRGHNSYKTAGAGNLSAWSELLCGLIYLSSFSNDWISRRMIRKNGGIRFLTGLAEHDSHNIRTLAIASLGNLIATNNTKEQHCWITRLTSYRAAKIFSASLISPLKDVTSSTSREASRALVNLALPHIATTSLEEEVMARQSSHWRGGSTRRWEKDGNWKLQLTYQSGGICGFNMNNFVMKFEDNGILTGSLFDSPDGIGNNDIEIQQNNLNQNRLLYVKGWYYFNQHHVGVGQISFTIYKSQENAAMAVSGLLSEKSHKSNDFLGGIGAIRNFTGYCNSSSRGFFGIWENSGSNGSARSGGSQTLTGGGCFRLRWQRAKKI
jgi:hypothetical protein